MASTGKCPYCGGVLRSDEKNCPNCGAVNQRYVEDTPRTVIQPKTIEELQEYCAERGMPLLRMRFFIGEDYREPKAFGIYRDGKDVVVYKNKGDGSRAVRYRGPDEAHGVNELFQKLLDECHKRGIYPDGKPLAPPAAEKKRPPIPAGLSLEDCPVPKTIPELQKLCEEKQIPLEQLGFVFGDSTRPNVTGIVKNDGKARVYRINSNNKRVYLGKPINEAAAVAQYFSLLRSAVGNVRPAPDDSDDLPTIVFILLLFLGFFPVLFGYFVPTFWKWIPGNRDKGWPEKRLRSKKELPPDGRISFFDRLAYNWNTFLFGEANQKTALTPREKQVERKDFAGTGGYALRGLLLILVVVFLFIGLNHHIHRDDGYYRAESGQIYYNDAGTWYHSYDGSRWVESSGAPSEDYRDYFIGEDWNSDWGVTSVRSSDAWEYNHQSSSSDSSSSSDWPSSSSSDYDPWDPDDTDWDDTDW